MTTSPEVTESGQRWYASGDIVVETIYLGDVCCSVCNHSLECHLSDHDSVSYVASDDIAFLLLFVPGDEYVDVVASASCFDPVVSGLGNVTAEYDICEFPAMSFDCK